MVRTRRGAALKLIEAAQERWRAVNATHLVALVRAGATFVNGQLVERPDETHRCNVRYRLTALVPARHAAGLG